MLETLLKAVDDPDANVRKASALALGESDNSHAKVALVKLLKDKVWQVKQEAIRSIGKAGVTEAVPHLMKITGCDSDGQALKIILKWAGAKGEETAPAGQTAQGGLMASAGKKKPEGDPWQLKKTAAITLSILRPELAAQPLVSMLNMDNPSARAAAMVGLANISAQTAVEPLIEQLSSSDWNTRKMAAIALGRLKAESAVSALVKLLDDDKFSVRIEAVIALNHIKPPSAVEILSKTVTSDNNYEVRKTAATALGNLRDEEAATALYTAIEDNNWMVRKAVVDALTNLKVIDATGRITPLLGDDQEDVRAAAAAGLITLNKVAMARS